jgi:acyl-CoA thioesterase FadM
MGTEPVLRFVTASLRVDFLRPTPIDAEIELRAFATEVSERKVKVAVTVLAAGEQTARGEVVTVRMPDSWVEEAPASS